MTTPVKLGIIQTQRNITKLFAQSIRERGDMNYSAIYHRTSEQMSYSFSEDDLVVNLKTGHDVDRVFLIYGDPYQAGIAGGSGLADGKRSVIEKSSSTTHGGPPPSGRSISVANIISNYMPQMK